MWLCEEVLKSVPHRHFVYSIPKILRRYFLYDRKLLSDLSRCGCESLKVFFEEAVPVEDPVLGGDGSSKEYRRNWARLIQKIYQVNPLICPKCQGRSKIPSLAGMRILAFIEDEDVTRLPCPYPGVGYKPLRARKAIKLKIAHQVQWRAGKKDSQTLGYVGN